LSYGPCNATPSYKENISPSIVMSFQCDNPKKDAPSAPKQMKCWVVSSWVGPPCYTRDWTITRMRLFIVSSSTTHWSVKMIGIQFHACITYTWTEIQDWLLIIVTSCTLKEKNLEPATIAQVFFKICSHKQSTISHPTPSN